MKSVERNSSSFAMLLAAILFLVLMFPAGAKPIRLEVRPIGSNQVQFSFSPVVPDVMYNILVRSNGPAGHWMAFQNLFLVGSSNTTLVVTSVLNSVAGLTLETLTNWTFVAGCWEDSDQDQLPDLYEELVSRTDPYSGDDGMAEPNQDGRKIIQKMQSNTDPFLWENPFPPDDVTVRFGTNRTATIRWREWPQPTPEYFIIEKAERVLDTNRMLYLFPRPRMAMPPNQTNFQNRPQPIPPFRQFPRPNQPNAMITGPYKTLARVPAAPVREDTLWGTYYHFTDTDADPLFQPSYRIQAHATPPIHVVPARRNSSAIRETIRSVASRAVTNGYDLTVAKPVAHAWYLLMVRDKNDLQWRAGGYFIPSNNVPCRLHVALNGMMAAGNQQPIALPEVSHLPAVVEPEFIAGSGEDSDGDGLPDIYEVLVTATEPDEIDTGHTGIIDGFKEASLDGWSNLEKFRRRVNPLHSFTPPPSKELKRPILADVFRAIQPTSDLRYMPEVMTKTNGASIFSAPPMPLEMFYRMANPRDPSQAKVDFDVLVSWKVPDFQAHEFHNGQPVSHGP